MKISNTVNYFPIMRNGARTTGRSDLGFSEAGSGSAQNGLDPPTLP
jgi:hypothetical protein